MEGTRRLTRPRQALFCELKNTYTEPIDPTLYVKVEAKLAILLFVSATGQGQRVTRLSALAVPDSKHETILILYILAVPPPRSKQVAFAPQLHLM